MSDQRQIYRSYAGIAPFRLHRPRTAADAVRIRRETGRGGAFLAGGVDLIPALRGGVAKADLITLGGIAELCKIERRDGTLRIGGAVTYRGLETDPLVAKTLPGLPDILSGVANIRVRHTGTVGGNLMTARATYDAAPILMALGARLVFALADKAGPVKSRRTSLGEAGGAYALLRRIEIPLPAARLFLFDRSLKPAISVALSVESDGSRISARAAVGCAFARPVCLPLQTAGAATPADLTARPDDIAEAFAGALPEPLDDGHAGAGYRRKMARVLLARLLRRLDG